jgi:hypothetical protein
MTVPRLTRLAALLAAALLTAPGCSLVYDNCLYDRVGCDLPGTWTLVARDGDPATDGRWEIDEGFVERGGYLVLPTGWEAFPVMRGSFSGNYSLDEDTPQTFILTFWSMPVENGTVYIDMGGRIENYGDDRFDYVVLGIETEIIFNGGGSNDLGAPPLLRPGTRLTFER